MIICPIELYIPIWLYSNFIRNACSSMSPPTFTFQSGYIQIRGEKIDLNISINFTFQSGYIQIMSLNFRLPAYLFFTFQSGYIQIIL